MAFTLTRENGTTGVETKVFHSLADGWVQIVTSFNQIVETHVAEVVDEWHGTMRFTGEIERQLVPSVHTSELRTEQARKLWAKLKALRPAPEPPVVRPSLYRSVLPAVRRSRLAVAYQHA